MIRVLPLLLFASAAIAAPDVAIVTDLRGDVQRQAGPARGWHPAALDEGLALLDLIRTGARSKTEMRFIDRTVLGIGEKTRLRISLALFNIRAAPEAARVALLAGQVNIAVHRSAQPLVVTAPSGQSARIVPGRRVRARIVDGRLVVEALPEGFRFASTLDDLWWAPDADLGFGPGQQPPGSVAPGGIPGALDPLDDEGTDPVPSGVDLTITPRTP